MSVAGSKSAQRELRDHKNLQERQRKSDLGWVMSTPQGRRFIFDLIERRCGVFSASYTGNSETYLKEGKRLVGIDLMEEVQQEFSNEYVQMTSEAFHGKRRDALAEAVANKIASEEDT